MALTYIDQYELMKKVRCFDDFNEDNDPYGEHDFGAVTVKDEKYFWKIDYYDKEADFHSSDASREDLTRRVLTVTRADEY